MSELAPESGVPEEVDAPEVDQWTGPSQQEWMETRQQLADATELVQAARAAQQPSTDPLDEYDPEFARAVDQRIAQQLTPYQQYQEQEQARQAEETLKDMFHDASVRDGEFDTEMARIRYGQTIGPMVQRYGATVKAAEEAVAAAASAQRDYEAQLRTAAVEQYQNQLRGISSAPREPAAGAVPGAQQHVTPQGGDEISLTRHYFPNAR